MSFDQEEGTLASVTSFSGRTRVTVGGTLFTLVSVRIESGITMSNTLKAGSITQRLSEMFAGKTRNSRIRLRTSDALRMTVADRF